MCGIIGAFSSNKQRVSSEKAMLSSMETMGYRGPDAADYWENDSADVSLGHLRLSILDPRPEGTQPMHLETANGKLTIVFNGEVYNYREIREELILLGYSFKTGTDTEVVLAAYAAWGSSCVERFNGMFAIAIYNDRSHEIELIRDRLGIKPLYFTINDDGLFFASEIKALTSLTNRKYAIEKSLVHDYMDFGFIPGQDTLQTGIKRLMPAHRLTFNRSSAVLSCYWRLNREHNSKKAKLTIEDATTLTKNTLVDSLKLRLRADVPIGVFLSGGLDSSALVALLSKEVTQPIKTFSVRYDFEEYGEEYDESKYAKQVAELFGTEHYTYTMTPNDFKSYIKDYVKVMDEPVTEAAAISLHFIAEKAKEHVTVVLSGEGSDEIFGGYDLYQYMMTIEKIRKIITPAGARLFSLFTKKLPQGNKIKKYIDWTALPFEERYRGISSYDSSYKNSLYQPDFFNSQKRNRFITSLMGNDQGMSTLDRMLDFDTKTWLVDDLLIKADRMSMASSLELRVPFLDYRLVELAASFTDDLKIKNGESKFVLKKMMEGLLPDNIIYRKKRGFPTPLAVMLKGPLKDFLRESITGNDSHLSKEFFNHSELVKLVSEHESGTFDHHRVLWQLLVLEEWLKNNSQ